MYLLLLLLSRLWQAPKLLSMELSSLRYYILQNIKSCTLFCEIIDIYPVLLQFIM